MFGSLISAGASLLGGLLGKSSADDAREAQMAMNAQNIQMQKDFAQQGIRWKVEDAKAAGIHPLYALGANTHSFSPVSSTFAADTSLPNAFAAAGQDIGRAVNATRTQAERDDAFTVTQKALALDGMKLDNDVKRAQLASAVQRIKQNAIPPMPDVVNTAAKFEDAPRLRLGNPRDPFITDPHSSNAEEFEKRYGEAVSDWIAGPMILWNDYKHTTGGPVNEIKNWWYGRHTFKDRFGKWSN